MKQGRIKNIENILKNKKIKTHGVEIDLTEEQLQKLQQLVEPKYKHPFERVGHWEKYYSISVFAGKFEVIEYVENHIERDVERFSNGNYYNNKGFAEQVAMDMNLQQRLRKFTYENGWSDEFWEDENISKVTILFDTRNKSWYYLGDRTGQQGLFGVYFKDFEVAKRAMEEIVEPFCKENPNYRFQEE